MAINILKYQLRAAKWAGVIIGFTAGTRSLYEIREALESMAIKLACQRATEEQIERAEKYHIHSLEVIRNRDVDQFIELNSAFHAELLAACGNEQLWLLIQTF